MYSPLDGPSKQGKLSSVGTATPVEVKVDASAFEGRSVITLQGTGKFYIYFADEGETPNAATVSANGFEQAKDSINTYEAGSKQAVFVLSVTGTIDIRIAERG